MTIISEPNIEKVKNLIRKAIENKEKPIIIQARDDEYNRKILEYGKFDILMSVEAGNRKDRLKQMDSGLNVVLADIAKKNKIAIGIDLKEINSLEGKQKAVRIARIIQNLRIARKSKVSIKLFNYHDKRDASSFLLSLGASSQQAKEALCQEPAPKGAGVTRAGS